MKVIVRNYLGYITNCVVHRNEYDFNCRKSSRNLKNAPSKKLQNRKSYACCSTFGYKKTMTQITYTKTDDISSWRKSSFICRNWYALSTYPIMPSYNNGWCEAVHSVKQYWLMWKLASNAFWRQIANHKLFLKKSNLLFMFACFINYPIGRKGYFWPLLVNSSVQPPV